MTLPRAPASSALMLPLAAPSRTSVTSLGRLSRDAPWRTEAMRSYTKPVLIWITRGQGRITFAGQQRGYGPFTLILLPPGTMHGFDRMGQVAGSVVFMGTDDATDWLDTPVFQRLGDSRDQMDLTAQIDALDREAAIGDAASADALHHMTGLLAVWLRRRVTPDAAAPRAPETPNAPVVLARPDRANALAAAFAALVEQKFRNGTSVADLARDLGVTATHLSRVCRRTSGRAAHDILSDRRHFEARRLLVDTDHDVSQISEMSGFSSPAYFSRAFRRATGQSPSAFRLSGRHA